MARFAITITVTVPDEHPGGTYLALRWFLLHIVDAIKSSPLQTTVSIERDTS